MGAFLMDELPNNLQLAIYLGVNGSPPQVISCRSCLKIGFMEINRRQKRFFSFIPAG